MSKNLETDPSRFSAELRALTAVKNADGLDSPDLLYCWSGTTKKSRRKWELICGDARTAIKTLPAEHFDCVVTSPPYFWQRDYKIEGQIGLEWSIESYVNAIADVMDEVRRVLKRDGVLFLNLGDTYYSMKGEPQGGDKKHPKRRMGLRAVDTKGLGVPQKTAIGIPWRVALELIKRKWVLRCPIIWQRPAPPPEPSVVDRPWKTYEHIFMFSKSTRYYFSRESLAGEEDIWSLSAPSRAKSHPAVFPALLVERCLKVGCKPRGRVLDPFVGSGTTMKTALTMGRSVVGIDISERFCNDLQKMLQAM